jgi:hypothetical protein
MYVLVQVFDTRGLARGDIRLNLDFGPPARWSLLEDSPGGVWAGISSLRDGEMEVTGSQVTIKGQPRGKLIQPVLLLPENPEFSIYGGGVGTVVASSDPALVNGDVYWSRELSPIRQAMRRVLDKWIPQAYISSDDPAFQDLTGWNTRILFDNKWEPENKQPPWPDDQRPKKDPTFTCCNMVVGALAQKLGQELGKKVGYYLGAGVLQLRLADSDRKGSWVWSSSGRVPQVGDFYAAKSFQHVGTIGEIRDGCWMAYDGGQGGYHKENPKDSKDSIKKLWRGPLIPSALEGWVDIDIYFK